MTRWGGFIVPGKWDLINLFASLFFDALFCVSMVRAFNGSKCKFGAALMDFAPLSLLQFSRPVIRCFC